MTGGVGGTVTIAGANKLWFLGDEGDGPGNGVVEAVFERGAGEGAEEAGAGAAMANWSDGGFLMEPGLCGRMSGPILCIVTKYDF